MLLLVDDTLGTLDVDDGVAYVTQSVQLHLPEVRAVVEPRVEADGTFDHTAYFGARAVVASILAFAAPGVSVEDRLDAVRRYLRPWARFALHWTPVGSTVPRRIVVRVNTHDVVISDPRYVQTTLALVAPSGLMESVDEHTVTLSPAAIGVELGRTYNLTFNRVYPASTGGPSEVIVHNAGTAATLWRAQLYGPCTDPKLFNNTSGQTLAFTGLTLPRGVYVELVPEDHTAYLNSDPTLSVYDRLTLDSTWWSLESGDNRIAFAPSAFDTGAVAVITWRDAWL